MLRVSGVRFTWCESVVEFPSCGETVAITVSMELPSGVFGRCEQLPVANWSCSRWKHQNSMRLWIRTSKDLSSDSTDARLTSRRRQARFPQALMDVEQVMERPGSHTHESSFGQLKNLCLTILRFSVLCFCFWGFNQAKENSVINPEIN